MNLKVGSSSLPGSVCPCSDVTPHATRCLAVLAWDLTCLRLRLCCQASRHKGRSLPGPQLNNAGHVVFLGKHVWRTTCYTDYLVEAQGRTSFLSSAGQSVRLLTSRSGVRASQGAFARAVKSPRMLQDVWQFWLGTGHACGFGYAARPPATRAGVTLAFSPTTLAMCCFWANMSGEPHVIRTILLRPRYASASLAQLVRA